MEPSQTTLISIPDRYDAKDRLRIGRDIIEKIKQRTLDGLDIENKPFAPYSKNYEKTGTVNVFVSGETLASLVIIGHGPGFVRIGFDDQDANDKASYVQKPRGQKKSVPQRQFVGISQKDLNIILQRY